MCPPVSIVHTSPVKCLSADRRCSQEWRHHAPPNGAVTALEVGLWRLANTSAPCPCLESFDALLLVRWPVSMVVKTCECDSVWEPKMVRNRLGFLWVVVIAIPYMGD